MMPGYPLVLASASADGAALTASITATQILHGSGVGVIPGSALQIGSLVRVRVRGRMSTIATTPGTLTLDLRFGSVIVSAFGAIALNTSVQTNATWEAEIEAVIRSVGAGTAATALATCRFTSRALIGSAAVAAGGNGVILLPDTAPAVGTGFDSTIATPVNVFATWSLNNANSIQTHDSLTEFKV